MNSDSIFARATFLQNLKDGNQIHSAAEEKLARANM
jgi:hypothetical protein